MIRTVFRLGGTGILAGLAGCLAAAAGALELVETPSLEAAVADGSMPPVAERVPEEPAVVDLAEMGRMPGRSNTVTGCSRRSPSGPAGPGSGSTTSSACKRAVTGWPLRLRSLLS